MGKALEERNACSSVPCPSANNEGDALSTILCGSSTDTKLEGYDFLGPSFRYTYVGELRILLVDDELTDAERGTHRVRTLKEYDVIGEIWVRS